jgi:alpha-beta hydrolase superfamily lysophospholipase
VDTPLEWTEDALLGASFEAAVLGQATLVRLVPSEVSPGSGSPRGIVLHVHGYNDYFFQAHVARAFAEAGYLFYAVDLRRAGRSLVLIPDDGPAGFDVPHFVTDLREQATDIAQASRWLRQTHPDLPLVVHAHSTGGLTASLWAHAHRHSIGIDAGPDALVLNSPFLAGRGSRASRAVGAPVLQKMGPLRPLTELSHRPSYYAQSLLVAGGGEWAFDTTLKRPEGLPVRAGWLVAVSRGHARVARGLAIACPVLLAASTASSKDVPDNPDAHTSDSVLDANAIVALAPRLGRDVTVLRIEGGVHDLALSRKPARSEYLDGVLAWLDEHSSG